MTPHTCGQTNDGVQFSAECVGTRDARYLCRWQSFKKPCKINNNNNSTSVAPSIIDRKRCRLGNRTIRGMRLDWSLEPAGTRKTSKEYSSHDTKHDFMVKPEKARCVISTAKPKMTMAWQVCSLGLRITNSSPGNFITNVAYDVKLNGKLTFAAVLYRSTPSTVTMMLRLSFSLHSTAATNKLSCFQCTTSRSNLANFGTLEYQHLPNDVYLMLY